MWKFKAFQKWLEKFLDLIACDLEGFFHKTLVQKGDYPQLRGFRFRLKHNSATVVYRVFMR